MTNRNAGRTLTSLATIVDQIGGTFPKAAAAALSDLTALSAKVRALDLRADLAAAVLTSVTAGNDPTTDPAVQREATRLQIRTVESSLSDALNVRAQAIIDEHAEAIIEALRKPFDTAARTLVKAHQRLGDVALEETQAILAMGGDAARVWADAQEAEQTVRAVHQAWSSVALATSGLSHSPQYRLLMIADVPPADWFDRGLRGSGMGGWEAVRAGFPLSLASPAEFAERVAGLMEEQEDRQRRPADRLAGAGLR